MWHHWAVTKWQMSVVHFNSETWIYASAVYYYSQRELTAIFAAVWPQFFHFLGVKNLVLIIHNMHKLQHYTASASHAAYNGLDNTARWGLCVWPHDNSTVNRKSGFLSPFCVAVPIRDLHLGNEKWEFPFPVQTCNLMVSVAVVFANKLPTLGTWSERPDFSAVSFVVAYRRRWFSGGF